MNYEILPEGEVFYCKDLAEELREELRGLFEPEMNFKDFKNIVRKFPNPKDVKINDGSLKKIYRKIQKEHPWGWIDTELN